MPNLPKMLTGAIALEFQDTVHAAWASAEEEKKKHKEHSKSVYECQSCGICADTVDDTCTVVGDTCSAGCKAGTDDCQKKKATFEPLVAGWSAPPPLPPA